MLDGLDSIDWASLAHAYGSAADVPAMIRALASHDRETRRAALHAAYGSIFHQGTRYTATPPAIGFIVELAADPQTPDRAELLALLVRCVGGRCSPTFGPVTASGTIWGETAPPMSDYGETVALLAACERAAEPAVPLALQLLAGAEARLRAHAAHLLATVHAHAARHEVAPRVHARMGDEDDPSVRAMLAFTLTHVLPLGHGGLAEVFAADPEPLARVLAAMGSVRRNEASPQMARALVEWLSDDALGEQYASLPFEADDLAGDIAALLRRLGPAVLHEALPTLLERLRTANDFGAVGLLAAALAAVFGDDVYEPARGLTGPQRRLLETLAHNQGFWSLGNAFELLGARGLPSAREAMAGLLGITVTNDPREAARIGARAFASFGPQRALKAWQELLAKYPDDREGLVEASILLVQLGQHEQALALLDRALAIDPPHGEHYGMAMFVRGNALFESGALEPAYAAFTAAQAELAGARAELARRNRITVLQRLGRADEALAIEYGRAPKSAADHYRRGLAEVKAGRYRESLSSLAVTLAREPDHANAHYTAACAHALLGEHDAALAAIARALAIEPALAPSIAADGDFVGLRGDARFTALVGA